MPTFKPQTRFLLRGSALIAGLLVVWWLLLLDPMVHVLKAGAGAFLQIQETPTGNWTLQVALERTLPATPQRVAQQIHSIEFDISRTDLIAFTFSLPVFWAIILAAPNPRQNLRALAVGTALMSAAELAMLFVFAQISARNAITQLGGTDDAISSWARRLGEYLIVSVLPFMMPFALAFSLHAGLRREILPAVEGRSPHATELPSSRRAKKRR